MDFNKNNIKIMLGLITFAILLFVGVQNIGIVIGVISSILKLIFPFVLGAGIAFVLNVPMSGIEQGVFGKSKSKSIQNMKRPISLLLTWVIVLSIIVLVFFLIVPEITRTIGVISSGLPDFINRLKMQLSEFIEKNSDLADMLNRLEFDWQQLGQSTLDFMRKSGGNMISSTFGIATSIVGGIVNFIIGIIFAIYILLSKEKLGKQIKKLMYAYLPEKNADRALSICSLSSNIFSRFLSGQCLEAVIIGIMFFLSMSVCQFPYPLMISVFIGFTALVPIVGTFIGLIIGAFLIVIADPVKALWFIIMFLILQQIEGNLIYPRVVGSSVGLPSMWVLVAVTLGGSTMGIAGMLIFIPMTSVLYTILRDAVNKRLKKNRINQNKYN